MRKVFFILSLLIFACAKNKIPVVIQEPEFVKEVKYADVDPAPLVESKPVNNPIKKRVYYTANVYFPFDSDVMLKSSDIVLKEAINIIQMQPTSIVLLTGACDTIGSNSYNYNLGLKRAEYIYNLINSYCFGRDITVSSCGEDMQRCCSNKDNRTCTISIR